MHEKSLHLTNPHPAQLPAPSLRRRLLFPLLIVIGVILVVVAVVLLLRGAGGASVPDTSLLV